MTKPDRINTLFLDIGGVLLTNGWGRDARALAGEKFNLDEEEFSERHHMTFDTYEEGKLSLDEYLNRVVFYRPRHFTIQDFKKFMFEQSQPLEPMIALIRRLKAHYGLKTVAVSNEGRELTEYRIREFRLNEFIDAFVFSCFVHFRKPDEDIYRIALDISQARPGEVAYLDDRKMFVEVAQGLGIQGIHNTGYESTVAMLKDMGLELAGA
jgi:putative hydrolase of the HAD superfamily